MEVVVCDSPARGYGVLLAYQGGKNASIIEFASGMMRSGDT